MTGCMALPAITLFGNDGNDRLYYSTSGTDYMTMYGGHGTQQGDGDFDLFIIGQG